MKIRLVHKLFASLLGTSLLIVVAMVATSEFYVSRNFADYVNKMELERVSSLIERFSEEYVAHQGWDHLRNNVKAWRNLLRSQNQRALRRRNASEAAASLAPQVSRLTPPDASPAKSA